MPSRSTSRSRRLLLVAAALALSAAACGGSDASNDGNDRDAAGTDGTSTTVSPDGAGGTSTDGSSDGAGGGGTTGSGGGISGADTAPLRLTDLKPNQWGAPLPGRYLYDAAGVDEPIQLSVRDVLDGQDAERFDRTGDLSQLHIEYEGAEARASLIGWSRSALRLDAEQRAQSTTSGANESPVCDYLPDLLLQPRSLEVGATWRDESSCEAKQGDVTVRKQRSLSGEVLAASSVQLDGATVSTVRIKRVIDTTTSSDTQPPLLVKEHRELTIEWVVSRGLAARIDGTVVDTVAGKPKPVRALSWTLRTAAPTE